MLIRFIYYKVVGAQHVIAAFRFDLHQRPVNGNGDQLAVSATSKAFDFVSPITQT